MSTNAFLPLGLLALASGFPGPATSQAPVEFKLTASDAAAWDWFGGSVAVSGDTALVGAIGDDDTALSSGSAYVFVRNDTGWIQQAKLFIDSGALYNFGTSVALSGDTALVGAVGAGAFSGAAYVFVRSGTTWIRQTKLTPSDASAGDLFGISVALSGNTALVGASGDNPVGTGSFTSGGVGAAYVFVRSGATWIQQAKLTASDAAAEDSFGHSVAVSGNTALVGARQDDDAGADSGSACVFVRTGGTWIQQAKLTASDAAAEDSFGHSVSVSGNTALVGARQDDDAGTDSGSAYVFVRSGATWIQQAKLTASDAAAEDSFGHSVAVSGDTAFVGARDDDDVGSSSGSAYVFVGSGATWTERVKLTASDGSGYDLFGNSVAVSGDTAVVGAHQDDDAGSLSGSAYAFVRTGTTWMQTPRAIRFGVGCVGARGIPSLGPAAGSTPRIGETFDVVLSFLPPTNPAFLVLGLSNTQWLSRSLPLSLAPFGAPRCSLLVSGDFFTGVVNTTGKATQGFFIPLDPSLVRLHIYFQGYVLGPGGNLFGLAASNGLDVTIGSF